MNLSMTTMPSQMRALCGLRGRLPRPLARAFGALCRVFDPHARISHAQEGEDIVIERLLGHRPHGFYVDVGAHHPSRYSNTVMFYDRGWRGINIDPQPECFELLRRVRPRDINVQAGVAAAAGELMFYRFNDAALNTFSRELADARAALPGYALVGTMSIRVSPLSELLRTHLPPGQTIDFLTIDAEGFDMEVLRSNDWDAFRPALVLIEALETSLLDLGRHEQCVFMQALGYVPVARTVNTVFYRDTRGSK